MILIAAGGLSFPALAPSLALQVSWDFELLCAGSWTLCTAGFAPAAVLLGDMFAEFH